MKYIRFYFCILVPLFITFETIAQEPAAQNGRFTTVEGLKIYYEDTGKGIPLVLLHGFHSTTSIWNPFVPQLSNYFRVISIDLPGHGRSDYMDTTDVYLHKRAAEYILGLLNILKIDSAYVMGSSSGAMITLYMATIKPQLTKKIVLIGGQVYFSVKTRDLITSRGPGIENQRLMESRIKLHGKQKAILLAKQFWNMRKLYGDPSFTPDVLSNIKANTLIIHGDNDPIAPVTNAWEMFQNIPNANLWIVPNGGHAMQAIRDSNKDDFIRRVLDFLQGNWERQ